MSALHFAMGHLCLLKDTKESQVFQLRQHLLEVSQLTPFKPILHTSLQMLSFNVTSSSLVLPPTAPQEAMATLVMGTQGGMLQVTGQKLHGERGSAGDRARQERAGRSGNRAECQGTGDFGG